LVYIPAREGSTWYGQDKDFKFEDDGRSWNTGKGYDESRPLVQDSLIPQTIGKLIAWDPVKQQEVWTVTHQSSYNAGVLTTKDLVFQGTGEGDFIIYDANTGEKLWGFPLQTGIVAPPITYMVDDIQYVTLVAGWGGGLAIWVKYVDQINPGGVYTFAIGGKKAPPTFPVKEPKELINLEFTATQEQIQHGQNLFGRYCGRCHGGGVIPNLSYSKPEIFEAFHQIVEEGIFLGKGMPKFNDRLSEQDINDVKNYILSNAEQQRNNLSD
jgi:quinohemoprotein ethanol dehydrogenase